MQEVCLVDIMAFPDESLKMALPRVSTRMLMRLLMAYPGTLGGSILMLLSQTMNPGTLGFLQEEISIARPPTTEQIRDAEMELIKTIHDVNRLPRAFNS